MFNDVIIIIILKSIWIWFLFIHFIIIYVFNIFYVIFLISLICKIIKYGVNSMNNYRPIYMLSNFSIILEKNKTDRIFRKNK